VTGVILPARADPEHPLAWGTAQGDPDGLYFVLHRTDLSFEPDDRSEAVIHFPLDVSEVSGVIGERKLDEVAGSSWLATRAIGEGRVVLFADDRPQPPLTGRFCRHGSEMPAVPILRALLADESRLSAGMAGLHGHGPCPLWKPESSNQGGHDVGAR
jgi:hypothetical protein